jgi:ABC-type transport system involved in cytochrome c biogenesis permease subunit
VRSFLFLVFSFLLLAPLSQAEEYAGPFTRTWQDLSWEQPVGRLAIQSGGRVKPLDTFAREGAELLTGKAGFENLDALQLFLSLAFEPQVWQKVKFLQIGGGLDQQTQLKRDLGLAEKEKYFSPDEVTHSPRILPLFQQLEAKQRAQEKLDPYFQALQRLGNQLTFLQEVVSGRALRLVPPTPEEAKKSDAWLGFDRFPDELKMRLALIAAGYTSPKPEVRAKVGSYASVFHDLVQARNPGLYPSDRDLGLEQHFNSLHPFRWAWVLALLSALVMTVAFYNPSPAVYAAAMTVFGASFLMQAYGFGLRCWIAGRPPVSNMYESVLWVSFGCMLFGLVLELVYRKRVIALGALIFSTFALIVADNVSGVLDAGIHPLEPVLRSNYWLTIHVLTITLGYAAFSLSLILGNLGLGQYVVFGRESRALPLRLLAFYAYRAVQVGVILLAAGTILGGVWADYSWGRFWGWDPKETWALIALLGYLALIHARFRGMVGPFGFLGGCVSAFLGVLMAWYGVNFVLGVGLHSYGFSSGGTAYVATYCTAQLLFLAWAAVARKQEAGAKRVPATKESAGQPV